MDITKKQIDDFIASNCEEKYRDFHRRLTKTNFVLNGVRVPIVRKFAKEIAKCENFRDVFDFENDSYEILMLKCLLVGNAKMEESEKFLYMEKLSFWIDDWALNDSMVSNFKSKSDAYFEKAVEWTKSNCVWQVRMGVTSLLFHFVDDSYIEKIERLILEIDHKNEYYIKMAIAWLVQVVAVKYESEAIELIKNEKLDFEIAKMAVRKIRDSYRIDQNIKDEAKECVSLRRKNVRN